MSDLADSSNIDLKRMLHLYIQDYCLKNDLFCTANALAQDTRIGTHEAVPICSESRQGLLYDWFKAFWQAYTKEIVGHRPVHNNFSREDQQKRTVHQDGLNMEAHQSSHFHSSVFVHDPCLQLGGTNQGAYISEDRLSTAVVLDQMPHRDLFRSNFYETRLPRTRFSSPTSSLKSPQQPEYQIVGNEQLVSCQHTFPESSRSASASQSHTVVCIGQYGDKNNTQTKKMRQAMSHAHNRLFRSHEVEKGASEYDIKQNSTLTSNAKECDSSAMGQLPPYDDPTIRQFEAFLKDYQANLLQMTSERQTPHCPFDEVQGQYP